MSGLKVLAFNAPIRIAGIAQSLVVVIFMPHEEMKSADVRGMFMGYLASRDDLRFFADLGFSGFSNWRTHVSAKVLTVILLRTGETNLKA